MVPNNLLAAQEQDLGGFLEGIGPLGQDTKYWSELCGDAGAAPCILTKAISNIVGIFSIIAIIWFVFLLLGGAISLMTGSGDKTKVQNAQKRITNGLIGLFIVLLGLFLINLVGSLIGIPTILSLPSFISGLKL
ncbi:hypothetical protein COS54_00780 [Candidatus Shapirobacteria bacterium CG03_land_8_20_14_0_80_39_12]|uniref:Uncharacterized protein n=1 Tax=Candidatus Shapirobacteria bacterium CG03_land_8_20_14_0_80_39_12 TaxID=1974879 RepID=A0A2M7BER8_9BACT|nr:MAG: hypothetical protein COS54_00780 [Candidatus Shapirobacteria bacterium CG03_land_8_20_14_0_80_39_12]